MGINSVHCLAYGLRQSIDAHFGLWTVAVVIVVLILATLLKAGVKASVVGALYLFAIIIGVVGACVLLWLPAPKSCTASSATELDVVLKHAGKDNPGVKGEFTVDIPGFLNEVHKNGEWYYTDGKESSLKLWPLWPEEAITPDAWSRFVKEHAQLRSQSARETAGGGAVSMDTNITRAYPAFVLRWQTATYDMLVAMCYQRLDGKSPDTAGVTGDARLRRMEITAPAHNTPFALRDYPELLTQFMANCGLTYKPQPG